MVENSYHRCKALGSVPNTRGRRERLAGRDGARRGGGGHGCVKNLQELDRISPEQTEVFFLLPAYSQGRSVMIASHSSVLSLPKTVQEAVDSQLPSPLFPAPTSSLSLKRSVGAYECQTDLSPKMESSYRSCKVIRP